MLTVLLAAACLVPALAAYDVRILSKGAKPAISLVNPKGSGYSPCTFTFNPAFIPAGPNVPSSFLILRASGCPAAFGGASDHLLMAYCSETGVCGDVQPTSLPFEQEAEDPRVFQLTDAQGALWTYLYYFASGAGQATVYLRRTQTPLNFSSYELVASALPWHRNGCAIVRPSGPHYVFYGESPPLPGLGVATTTDFVTYTTLDDKWMVPNGPNASAPEIVIEAGSTPVQLSDGNYLHLYAAGTPGWVKDGNYTGGWVILDKDAPEKIVAKSQTHLFVPTMD
jgi:hypothetical protein